MKKWRSRVTTDGLDRAPHRAFMRAMGLDDAALEKPMIGVVSMKGEQTPCNMTHDFQVDAAKVGIAEAGGTPREFSTISVSDGISMNHEGMKFSLLSRELIADSSKPWSMVGLRCVDRFWRLRQNPSGRDDGNDPVQRAVDLYLWRQCATRTVRGKNPHGAGFLRGRRRLYDRRNRPGDACGYRAGLVPTPGPRPGSPPCRAPQHPCPEARRCRCYTCASTSGRPLY